MGTPVLYHKWTRIPAVLCFGGRALPGTDTCVKTKQILYVPKSNYHLANSAPALHIHLYCTPNPPDPASAVPPGHKKQHFEGFLQLLVITLFLYMLHNSNNSQSMRHERIPAVSREMHTLNNQNILTTHSTHAHPSKDEGACHISACISELVYF